MRLTGSMIGMGLVALLSAALLWAAWRRRPPLPDIAGSQPASPVLHCWWLWACFLLGGVFVTACSALVFGQPGDTTLGYALRLFSATGTDSWRVMFEASAQLRNHPDTLVYEVIFFEQRHKFQYPLTALLLVDIPQTVLQLDNSTMVASLQVISRLCVPFIGIMFALLLTRAAQDTGASPEAQRVPVALAMLLGMASVVLFYPIARSEVLGQIQTAMTLCAAVALWAWQRGKTQLAGVLIGLCCVIKPHWLVVVLWGLLRRQWSFAVSASVTVCFFALLAIGWYGIDNVFNYIPVVSYIGRHGESFYPNQSVNGLVNRLLFNGSNLEWSNHAFAPFHPAVYGATVVSSVLLLGFALFWNRAKQPTVLDLSLVLLTLTMASPIAWEHHYGVLLPIFAVLLPAAVRWRPWGAWTIPLLWLGFLGTSQSFTHATNWLADSRWNFVQSHVLFGALIVLALLYRISFLERRPLPVAAEPWEPPHSVPGTFSIS